MDVAAELALKADSRDITRADKELNKLANTAKRTETATERMNRENDNAVKRFSGLTSGVGRYVLGLVGIGAAIATVRSGTQVLMGFGQSMAQVSAITRATQSELEEMTAVARQLGATTEFSASQAADGFKFLGQAGFTAKESIAAIPDVLNLATAAALDLGTAADIASNIMSGFGINADDASRATDVMAAIASRANTDVSQLGDAMKMVGPVASAMGIDIGDAAAAVGVLSDAGLQGTMAGTGLRRVLSALANPTKEAASVLKDLKINLEDVNPATNDLADVIDTLSRSGIDAADALTIFGDRGGPALLALVANNERLGELAGQMSNVEGEAKRMAETMRDTLKGDTKGLGSALQELALVIGGSQETSMRGAVQSTTGFVRELGIELQAFTSYSLDSGEASVASSNDYYTARDAIVALLNVMNIVAVEFQDLGDWLGYVAARTKLAAQAELAARTLQFKKAAELNDQIIMLDKARAESREAAEARIVKAISAQTSASEKLRKEMEERKRSEEDMLTQTEKHVTKLAPLYELIDEQMSELVGSTAEGVEVTEEFAESIQKVLDKLYPQEAAVRALVAEYDSLKLAVDAGIASQKDLAEWANQNALKEIEVSVKRVSAELVIVNEQAAEMEKVWEQAGERIDTIFGDAWEGAFDSFNDFADGLLDGFKRLLAEMAHLAITRPILVSLGMGGSGSAMGGVGGLLGGGGSGGGLSGLSSLASIGKTMMGGWAAANSMLSNGFQSAAGFFANNGMNGMANGIVGMESGLAAQGGQFGIAGGALATAGAGIAGSYAGTKIGESVFGKEAGSAWGASAGSAFGAYVGSIIPGLGTAFGAAIGGFIGGIGDALFGSEKNRIGGADIDFTTGDTKMWGTMRDEYQKPMQQLADILQGFAAAIGGSEAMFSVSAGNKSKLKMDGQEYDSIEDLIEDAMDLLIRQATELSWPVKELARAFQGTMEETVAYTTSLQNLWNMAEQNPLDTLREQLEASNNTLHAVYSEQQAALRNLAAEFDGSINSTMQLTNALAGTHEVTYVLAQQFMAVQASVDTLFGGLAENIRTSLMSQEELYDYQRNQVDILSASLQTLSDPQRILETSQQIEQLIGGMWSRLSEEQRQEMGPGFLNTVEDAQRTAQERLTENLEALERQAERNGVIVQEAVQAASNNLVQAAASYNTSSLTIQQAAAMLMEAAAAAASGRGAEVN